MPDTIGLNGLETKSLTTLVAELSTSLQTVYGSDINIDSNSPDGQLINIIAQEGVDLRELITLVNADFDPDQAEGAILDQRLAINNVKRSAGTFSSVDISIITDRSISFIGLDTSVNDVSPAVVGLYTVKDSAGNLCYLRDSFVSGSSGTFVKEFRAGSLGAVLIPASTMTTPVTILPGVLSVNNPNPATTIGSDEETDSAVKIRRRKSIAASSVGLLGSVEGALTLLSGVTAAFVSENYTGSTDAYGTPGHTIWAIVEGGTSADIAQVLYAKKSLGCDMRGDVSYSVPRTLSRVFIAKFDRPINVNLYIKFTLTYPNGVFDTSYIKTQIVNNVFWDIGQDAVNDVITTYVRTINSNYRVTSCVLSLDGITYSEIITSSSPQNRFVNAVSRISIL